MPPAKFELDFLFRFKPRRLNLTLPSVQTLMHTAQVTLEGV